MLTMLTTQPVCLQADRCAAMQATDETAELRTRLTRTEANLKAVHNEAAEGETALATLNEELQKLQGALAQAAKVGTIPV